WATQRERSFDITAAPAALPGHEIVFEIRIARSYFAQRADCFNRQCGSSEVCVNDNAGSVDDRLKSADAEFIERVTQTSDNRLECWDLALRANFGKFAAGER